MTLQLRPIKKPPKSKIKLTKSSSSLSIRISPLGFHLYLLTIRELFTSPDELIVFWTISAFVIPLLSFMTGNFTFLIFSFPGSGMVLFASCAYLYYFRLTTYLKIENQTVVYVRSIFTKKNSRQKPIARSEIRKLAFTPKYSRYDSGGSQECFPA
jgi:hypothetical protein